MSKRPEDMTDEELNAHFDDLEARTGQMVVARGEAMTRGDDSAPGTEVEDLLDELHQVTNEMSRRDALARRKAGGYAVELDVDGETVEYELKAATLEEAEAEAASGARNMAEFTGQRVTFNRILGPLGSQ